MIHSRCLAKPSLLVYVIEEEGPTELCSDHVLTWQWQPLKARCETISGPCQEGAARFNKNWKESWFWHRARRGRSGAKVVLKWAKLGWSRPEGGPDGPAGGEVSGAAVQWFRLHNVDGLQRLHLPWPSAGSNAGHRGVQDEKKIGEGWATKIYLTKRRLQQLLRPKRRTGFLFYYRWIGALEIAFGAHPKKISWGWT